MSKPSPANGDAPLELPSRTLSRDGDKDLGVPLEEPAEVVLKGQGAADFPDGGLAAWTVVFGAWCASFCSFGILQVFGVYNAYYATTLTTVSSGAIAMIGAIQLFCLFFVGMLVGKAFDRGYLRPVIAGGSVLLTFSLFAMSWGYEYWHFLLAQGIGAGIGMGCLFIPALSTISHYFRARRGLALGIASAGSSVGGIILPIQFRQQIQTVGFPWAVRTSAFIVAALLLAANLCLRTRLPPKHDGRIIDFRVFRDPIFCWWASSNFFSFLGIYTPLFFITRYALHNGVDTDLAYNSIAIASASSTVGRILPLWLADKIGLLNVLLPSTLVCAPLMGIWLACTTYASTIVFALVYGFFSGVFVSGNPAGTATLTADMREIGLRNGMNFFASSWAGLAGAPIAGAIIGKSYAGAAGYAAGCVLTGSFCMFMARRMHVRKTGNSRT